MSSILPSPDERDTLIARLLAENAALRRQIHTDTLSGLYGRRHFDERLAHEWLRAERFWTPLSLIAIDLDGIDDAAGIGGGEAVRALLAWIGALLESGCRDVDIPARVGRSAFAVILPATNRTGAEAELLRLRRRASERPPPAHGVRLSFGLAVAFDEAQSPLELLMLADEAALLDKQASPPDDDDVFDAVYETVPVGATPTWIDAA